MRRVQIISPFRGSTPAEQRRNVAYAHKNPLKDAARWVVDLYFQSDVAGESWPTAADKAMGNLRAALDAVGGAS